MYRITVKQKVCNTIILLLLISSNAIAQPHLTWSGLQQFQRDEAISQRIVLIGDVTIQIPEGRSVNIIGEICGSPYRNAIYTSTSYSITLDGGGFLQITSNNILYNGVTTVLNGTLQVGNGVSGHITYTSRVVLDGPNSIIRFEPAGDLVFSKVISGEGQVIYKGAGDRRLFLTFNNTYTGTTTIESGILAIGNHEKTGHIDGNIIVKSGGMLEFRRQDNYTFPYNISGEGQVSKFDRAVLTLSGNNTYTGQTHVRQGILQIGDGTSGSITSDITLYSDPSHDNNVALRFEPGGDFVYDNVISGSGSVEYSGTDSKQLTFAGFNTYTGNTTVEKGVLTLGVEQNRRNVIVKDEGRLNFDNDSDFSFSGVISGKGSLSKFGKSKLTLYGIHPISGILSINEGVIALDEAATIESVVVDIGNNGKFDISSGSKTIRGLQSNDMDTDAEVVLGPNRLTIAGGGRFAGRFTGTGGGVSKTETDTFSMQNTGHTANGVFSLSGGTLQLGGNWAGGFYQLPGTTLDVIGTVTIGGGLTLYGGAINMNLNGANPSTISVNGPVSTPGVTSLNIITNVIQNQSLIQATFGLISASPFLLDTPGFPSATLTATGTQLLLNSATGTQTPLLSNPLKAWTQGGTLHVSGLTPWVAFSVHNLSGALIYQSFPASDKIEIPLPAGSFYVIRSGEKAIIIRQ